MKEISPIERAVIAVGSQSALARMLSCTPQHVQKMCASGHVPAGQVLKIEAAAGVSRHQLRPDLYPDPSVTMDTKVQARSHHVETGEPAGRLSSISQASL